MARLYGIGVGPGDPELMTLKAVRCIKESGIIALPASGREINAAYTIAKGVIPTLDQKNIIEISMPMTKDKNRLEESHRIAAESIIEYLDIGEDVAFLTLGDPSVYSTYIYVHDKVRQQGYQAEMIPGVPSFCAAAARLGEGLTEADQPLHIIPASYDCTDESMKLAGTKVLMKSGKSLGQIKEMLKDSPNKWQVKMVERCGMEGERIFHSADDIDERASYFSIVIVKDK